MARINKFGLTDTIKDGVKREIRQRCGFGCVNCGNAVYQYEHVEPTFAEATEHNPNHIVLLCGGCHDRVTRKILSKETIKLRSQKPYCLNQGFSFGPFDLGLVPPKIKIGTLLCEDVETLIRINGNSIFSIHPPEVDGAPFRINALLADREGKEILKIVDNEWVTTTENWDVEVVGRRITIRKALGDIVLILRTEPPRNLIIERLEMEYLGSKITCRENQNLKVISPTGYVLNASAIEILGSQVGVDINNESMSLGVGGGSVSMSMTTGYEPPPIPYQGTKKTGRNAQCPCKSGKKFKKCCGTLC